jgi:hypothetical protein
MLNTILSEEFPKTSALLKVVIISIGLFQSARLIIDNHIAKAGLL